MAHLTKEDRLRIENMLNAGVSATEMSRNLGKSHTTISREIKKHRQEETTDRRRSHNYCIFKNECNRSTICKIPPSDCPGRCSQCKIISCNKYCLDFIENKCLRLDHFPHVCNGCREMQSCRKRKFFYIASTAMEEYRILLTSCREGIDTSPEEFSSYVCLIRNGLNLGQSLHHIMAAHKDVFQKCEKTIYNYFHNDSFSLPRGDMPKMCQRKPKKKEKIRHKIDPKYRTGRTYNDFKQYIEAHPDIAVVQMDSVVGSDGGKVLLTINFDCGLMLACIRNTNNSQSVIDYFDNIEKQFGLKMFKKLFPVILTDNGSEFSNPTAIETSITGAQRTKIFFCDPNSAWQKGFVENNHLNLRRILPKRTSFNALNQEDINLLLSHLNSYIRKQYDDIPAIRRFESIYGKKFLAAMGISPINPKLVTMDPILLKGKI